MSQSLVGKTGDYKKIYKLYQYARASASELGTIYFHEVS